MTTSRAAQKALWAIEDEVIDRLGPAEWNRVLQDNTYHRPGETLEVYRDAQGVAQYRFRPLSPDERRDRIEGKIEDQL